MSQGLLHVSERHHAGLIFMLALAKQYGVNQEDYLTLQQVSGDMPISSGYLEEIVSLFKQAGLIEGRTGPRGGYRLACGPKEVSLQRVFEALDGPVRLVACQHRELDCPAHASCASRTVWDELRLEWQRMLSQKWLGDML